MPIIRESRLNSSWSEWWAFVRRMPLRLWPNYLLMTTMWQLQQLLVSSRIKTSAPPAQLEGPLCEEYALVEGEGGKEPGNSNDGVRNWFAMLAALENVDTRDSLLQGLSQAQRNSLLLLEEWWYCQGTTTDTAFRQWLYCTTGPAPSLKKAELDDYGRAVRSLFGLEFLNVFHLSTQKSAIFAQLDLQRQETAAIAAAHRTAIRWLEAPHQVSNTDTSSETARPELSLRQLPGCIETCPWLSKDQVGEYPGFVWDIVTNKTVSYPEDAPAYTVVSHTWGRWQDRPHKAGVPGVPWPIPCNKLFEVQDLPHILSRNPFPTRYIWLDLVCIPQDYSDPRKDMEISKQAGIFSSAKHACIWFNQVSDWIGVSAAVSWLSLQYVKEHEISCTSIPRLESDAVQHKNDSSGLVKSAESERNPGRLQFFKDFYADSPHELAEPDGWFTSLWTLQEACLRPDFILCDATWRPLCTPVTKQPIPLDHLIALTNTAFSDRRDRSPRPQHVSELGAIFARTAMDCLHKMSVIDVLIFGNQRWCEDTNRAVAIMSVLGVRDWFKTHVTPSREERKKVAATYVEGKYPIEFVREVQAKFGSLFYSVVDLTPIPKDWFQFDDREEKITNTMLRASMLPVTEDAVRRRVTLSDSKAIQHHPAVQTWTITSEGSVVIKQVGILAAWAPSWHDGLSSWLPNYRKREPLTAAVSACISGERFRGEVNLHEWLGSFRPKAEKYAVCLHRKLPDQVIGILLERMYLEPGRRRDFIKFGTFHYTTSKGDGVYDDEFQFPPTERVNWRVV